MLRSIGDGGARGMAQSLREPVALPEDHSSGPSTRIQTAEPTSNSKGSIWPPWAPKPHTWRTGK